MTKLSRVNAGFTLIEVLIALSILTVGILAVGTMQISALRGNEFSDSTTTALVLAEDKMEELFNSGYSDLELTDGSHNSGNIDEMGQSGGRFYRTWNVKEITMVVTWDNGKHHVSLDSIKRQ